VALLHPAIKLVVLRDCIGAGTIFPLGEQYNEQIFGLGSKKLVKNNQDNHI